MTSQKRPAAAALSRYPVNKHPRLESLTPLAPDLGPSNQHIAEQGLWSRWKDLLHETVSYLMGYQNDSLPQFNFDPPPPVKSSSTKPECSRNASPPSPPRQHTRPSNGIMPSNILASTSTLRSSRHPIYTPHSATSSVTNTSASVDDLDSTPRSSRITSKTSSRVPSQSFTTLSSEHSESVQSLERTFRLSNLMENGVRKPYRGRHIYGHRHKAKVKEERIAELFQLQKQTGYKSDFSTFEGRVRYAILLERTQNSSEKPKTSLDVPVTVDEEISYVERAIRRAKLSALSPKPPRPFSPSLDELEKLKNARNEAVAARLRSKRPSFPTKLTEDELREFETYRKMKGDGIASAGKEKVGANDLERLYKHTSWLNDEIINFYGQLIMDRAGKPSNPSVHYFSSFFWPKLTGEGYLKSRLNRWTKKIDIFVKDYILIAVNHNGVHWTSAAINFKQKRIESYDSMGSGRPEVFSALRNYLDLEHRDKKKKSFDFTGWTNHTLQDYPQQENGYDCGVFTCATLEAIARGKEEFDFTQANMPYIRNKMVVEIGRAKLSDSH